MGSATVLMVGMASTLVIASKAFDDSNSVVSQKVSTAEVQADMLGDLRLATGFSELTATAVTFTVPDRDGGG